MRQLLTILATAALVIAAPARAGQPQPAEADPGVRPTRLIDRDEIRVSRVALEPGATRRVHTHEDVEYHVWIALEGQLDITVGSDAPVAARPEQAFFMKRGTPHGFRNTGTTRAAAFEIFVKQTAAR